MDEPTTTEPTPATSTESSTEPATAAGDETLAQRAMRELSVEVVDRPDRGSGRAVLITALLFSLAGFLGFQFFAYPALTLVSDTMRVLAIVTALLSIAVLIRPRLHVLLIVLLVWGLLLLYIAVETALPVGLFDGPPSPSFTLYAAHLVLAIAQVPLIASAWGRLLPRA